MTLWPNLPRIDIVSAFVIVNLLAMPQSISAADRPNIVLVMADDQGWGDMAYQGHPHLHTPHFDEAASTGLRFDRFYAAAPVCSPTRASVLTGRTPNRSGVFQWGYPLRPQEITVAELLRDAGYRTAHFGKWHLGSVRESSPVHPGRQGFDTWLSAPNFYDNDPILSRAGRAETFEGESSHVTMEEALAWIKNQADGPAPFFAVIWFGSPHLPHRAADEDRRHYAEHAPALQNFYGEITGMDRAFGQLRQSLRDLEIHENTVLWYCSDNGALPRVGSAGQFRGRKADIYEGGLLVPSILEWPSRMPGSRHTDLRCGTVDIFPTVLEIAGVAHDSSRPLDGESLVPLIDGQKTARQGALGFWNYQTRGIGTPSAQWMSELLTAQQAGNDLPPHPSSAKAAELPSPPMPQGRYPGHAAWIDGDWKLHRIEAQDGAITLELYDLSRDPYESANVLTTYPDRAARMNAELHDWLTSVVQSFNGADYGSLE